MNAQPEMCALMEYAPTLKVPTHAPTAGRDMFVQQMDRDVKMWTSVLRGQFVQVGSAPTQRALLPVSSAKGAIGFPRTSGGVRMWMSVSLLLCATMGFA